MENQLKKKKKIREITSPIENLQGRLSQIANLFNQFKSEKLNITQYLNDESSLNQIKDLTTILENINKNLKHIFTNNINEFINIKNILTNKYKTDLKNNLKFTDLNNILTRQIGQSLIEKRKISKRGTKKLKPSIK